jgi:hypothetical protein
MQRESSGRNVGKGDEEEEKGWIIEAVTEPSEAKATY